MCMTLSPWSIRRQSTNEVNRVHRLIFQMAAVAQLQIGTVPSECSATASGSPVPIISVLLTDGGGFSDSALR
ncbi:hypothetical protein ACVIWU_007012 [Bradyrhizobium sp. USDA 4509]|nr:hypothetical protein A6X20_40220 [Bradyrhizobium elkanii]ODM78935.1 hypothetical protein A6452_29935 [Bradyrhizobium elkanii]